MSIYKITDLRVQKLNEIEVMLFHENDMFDFTALNVEYYQKHCPHYVTKKILDKSYLVAPNRIKAFS